MSAQAKAITSHGLMLLNLLFPVVVYLVLFVFWLNNRKSEHKLLYVAINQAWIAATLSTALFVVGNLLIITLAAYKSTFALITFEIYFVFVVPIFLIPGLLGLVKSNAHIIYYYPLIGRRYHANA